MDQWSKTTSHLKRDSDKIIRRTSFLLWFQACQVRPPVLIIQLQRHLQDRRGLVLHLLQARLLQPTVGDLSKSRLENERIELKVILLQCLCQVPMLIERTRCGPSQPKTSHNKQKGNQDRTGQPGVCRLWSRKF